MFIPRVRVLPKHHFSSENCAVGLASFSCFFICIRCYSCPHQGNSPQQTETTEENRNPSNLGAGKEEGEVDLN